MTLVLGLGLRKGFWLLLLLRRLSTVCLGLSGDDTVGVYRWQVVHDDDGEEDVMVLLLVLLLLH